MVVTGVPTHVIQDRKSMDLVFFFRQQTAKGHKNLIFNPLASQII